MELNDFHYDLPNELIARYPLAERRQSRLLYLNPQTSLPTHTSFERILEVLLPGDLLIFNNTKVIPARLLGKKITGGQVEVLLERILDQQRFSAQIRASKPVKVGSILFFSNHIQLEVVDKKDAFYTLKYTGDHYSNLFALFDDIGRIPLPPYMERSAEEADKNRYQTIYAKHQGSVAAPTAGFHFDEVIFQRLKEKNIQCGFLTLHIGAGTFAPVRVTDIRSHKMHSEYFHISNVLCEQILQTKQAKKRIIAVGTTSLRALESASQSGETKPYQGETDIFIYPGYRFNCVDMLITNLHLPGSTLLMLVCAFAGFDKVMHAYREAVKEQYRFYSYGDAMCLTRCKT